MQKINRLSPLQWYLTGGLLAVAARFVEPHSEMAYVVMVGVAVVLCITGIVKYFRS